VLHRSELEAIQKILDRIRRLEQRLEALGDDSYERGRLVEACKAADAALTSILIVAEVHLGLLSGA